jgi:hypothetical protein
MARASERVQKIMMTLIMIPMWINFLIRPTLDDHPCRTPHLQRPLTALGLGGLHISGTEGAVVIAWFTTTFPI